MPYNLPFELEEVSASLAKPKAPRTSRQLPKQTAELVTNPYDRSAGFLRLEVQGFPPEEHEHLLGRFTAALSAKQRLDALADQLRAEVNPSCTAAGDILADAAIAAQVDPYRAKASASLYEAAHEVLRFGVVGWAEGELCHRGRSLGFASAPSPLLGKRRDGLSSECLGYLLATPFWLLACVAILEVSSGVSWPTAEEQWQGGEDRACTALADWLQWATGANPNRPFALGRDQP